MLHAAKRVPTVVGERRLRVKSLADARRAVPNPPAWHTLVVKGLALVSTRVPELRRSYLSRPWPRLFEAPYSVACVVFDREFGGEPATFLAPMLHPERLTLSQIADKVRRWKTDPIEQHGVLRRLVRNAKPPTPVRRLLWSVGLNWNGLLRTRMFGTYAVNSVAAIRTRPTQLVTPITTVWYYGSVNPRGEMDMVFGFDHRVFDGVTIGRAVSELENVFNGELAAEVRAS